MEKHLLNSAGLLFILLWLLGSSAYAQNKYEREYRITKSEFPEKAIEFLNNKLNHAKRIRFYRETDSAKTSFEAKLKKDKLHYSIEFNEKGDLEDIEITIKSIDIPDENMNKINSHLKSEFKKFRIRKMQQQYPSSQTENPEITIKNAFQNLLLPSINYELIVAGKKSRQYMQYEFLFDAEGNFLQKRKSLPANYDHVLY